MTWFYKKAATTRKTRLAITAEASLLAGVLLGVLVGAEADCGAATGEAEVGAAPGAGIGQVATPSPYCGSAAHAAPTEPVVGESWHRFIPE
jgi:hypothetical protein